jgi:aspartyl-tRNA(Asn)/glutamyl-tRNA(Gln) amidotransferase subunit C
VSLRTAPLYSKRDCPDSRALGAGVPGRDDIIAGMSLTLAEVEHIAALARLRLTDAEKARYAQQLSAILAYMNRLRQVDTSAIEPTATVLPLRSVLRPDVVTPSLPVDELLAQAPQAEAQMFRVPPVLE